MVNIVLSVLGRDQSAGAMKSANDAITALTAKRDQASRALSAASARDADAVGRVRVATLALADAQAKYGEESTQAVRAAEQLASAQRASVISSNNAEDATARLTAAEARVAEAATRAGNSAASAAARMRAENDSAASSADHVGSSFGGMLTSFVSGGALAAGAFAIWQAGSQALNDVGNAVINATKASISFDSQLENANIGFTTMLGSGSKATAMLADLQKFALSTPFRFGDLTQYAQQMIGYGIKAKEIIPDLTALGDAASGAGRLDTLPNAVLAFEQMAARGKVDLGDLNQLTNAGVPAQAILAAKYHVTRGALMTMISAGKIASSDALPKLIAGIEGGTSATSKFGGMMTKQSQTFSGAVSNIQDALQQAGGKAFQPFFKMAEHGAQVIAGFVSSKQFGKWVSDTSKSLGDFVKDVGGALKQVFDDPKVQAAGKDLFADVQKGMKGVGPAMKTILPDLISFGKQVLPAIVGAADKVAKHIPDMIKVLKDVARYIKDIGPIVADIISVFGDWMSAAMKVSAALDKGILDMQHKLSGMQAVIAGVFKNAASWLLQAGSDIISGLVGGITGAAGNAISTVANLGANLVSTFAHAIDSHSPSKKFHQLGVWIPQGLGGGILQGTASYVTTAMDTLVTKVQDGYTSLGDEASKARARLKTDEDKHAALGAQARALERRKQAAEEALASAKTEKQRKAAQNRLATIADEMNANRKKWNANWDDITSTKADIAADGTAAERSKREAAILKQIAGVNTQLDALATARDNVATNLKNAQSNLTSAMTTRSDFAANVQSSVRALGALTGATASGGGITSWSGSTSTGSLTWQDEVAHLQSAISTASNAKTTFAALKNLGLNTQSYSELESAFQSNGDLTAATSLLQGGAGAVGQVNQLESQLGGIGSSFGSDTSSTLYDAGVNAAQGVVDGLQQADDQLTAQMTKLGAALAKSVRTELAAKYTTAKNTGVNVGTINVGGAHSTADLLAALDWASKVQV